MKYKRAGKLLKKKREEAEVSQITLGRMTGIHSQFISNVERQLCFIPKKRLKLYVKTLGMTDSELQKLQQAVIADEKDIAEYKWKKAFASFR